MDILQLHQLFLDSSGVSTDTRNITEGNIFFALKGPSFNGNSFADQALQAGAGYAVVDEALPGNDPRIIRVADVLSTLQELARYHRRQFSIPVIGLTGSNGKTTTKELMRDVLATRYRVLATRGNLNNHIGVPLTLLEITPDTEMAIIEMGANHLGEIALLCSIAEPTHGLITNIGKAHIGTFGGFENILRGKSELYDYLIRTGGTIFVNMEDPCLSNMTKRISAPRKYPENIRLLGAGPFLRYADDTGEIETRLTGEYNFFNVAAAKAVGSEFRIDPELANKAIAGYIPENNRSQLIKHGSASIIMDAYNANPSSMSLAISHFAAIDSPPASKLMILGDMYELGDEEVPEHRAVGQQVKKTGIRACYVGALMENAAREDPDGKWFPGLTELGEYLQAGSETFDWLLVKGSRGMRLERVLPWLK